MHSKYVTRLVRIILAFFVIAFFGFSQIHAQTPELDVRNVIDQLFDGMRAGDSTSVRAVFHPDAVMVSSGFNADGIPVLRPGSIDRFVNAVGTPHEQVWDERIWDVKIRVDDNLSTAWMKFAFFAGDTFSHCGVNSFTLARDGDQQWRVIFLSDTRRTGDTCEMPPE